MSRESDAVGRRVWDKPYAPIRVYHCENPAAAFARFREPHHNPWGLLGNCWRCRQPLGCPRCCAAVWHGGRVALATDETWCGKCGVWQDSSALLRQGIVRGMRLANHPTEWVSRFRDAVVSGEFFKRVEPACTAENVVALWDAFRRHQIQALGAWERGASAREPGHEG